MARSVHYKHKIGNDFNIGKYFKMKLWMIEMETFQKVEFHNISKRKYAHECCSFGKLGKIKNLNT